MRSQDRVDILADVFEVKFTAYGVTYTSNCLLRELAPPMWISDVALSVDESETDPTLVRNKLM